VVAPGALEEAYWEQRQPEARDAANDLHLGATARAGRLVDLVFPHGRTIAENESTAPLSHGGGVLIRLFPSTPKLGAMPHRRPSKKDSPKKLAGRMKRRWRIVLLRAKGEILGEVEASDVASAKAAAAVQFELDEIHRSRIMVQELG
jgi:hypothetical protein